MQIVSREYESWIDFVDSADSRTGVQFAMVSVRMHMGHRFGGLLCMICSWSQQGKGTGVPDDALRITANTYAPIDSCVCFNRAMLVKPTRKRLNIAHCQVGNSLPSNGICIDERTMAVL